MALKFPDTVREDRADILNARAGPDAYIRIYSGSQPADADTAASGTLLAELRGHAAGFGVVSPEGVLTASVTTQDASSNATGTAGWFRVLASDGTTVAFDGSVGTVSAEMLVPSVDVVATMPFQVSAFVITEGNF